MNFDLLRDFCLSLPGTTEGIKWEEHLCFMIEEKMFLITDISAPHRYSLKVDEDRFDELTEREGITQAGHMAKRKWISVAAADLLGSEEAQALIRRSRELVLQGLPKKVQAKYG